MVMPESIKYLDAKARVVRALGRITRFTQATNEYLADQTSTSKRAKVETMLLEVNDLRANVDQDIQVMETAVGSKTSPIDVTDNTCSTSLSDSFDQLYYDLIAMAHLHTIPLTKEHEISQNQTTQFGNSSIYQLPKRKFPTFSGSLKEYQGFEDLFNSILSHTPELQDVEKFEYLKTSLEGEALSLVSHLSLTSANYQSAWKILRSRYGNKRDLARIHLDALLAPQKVTFANAASIKHVINIIQEHIAALDNLNFITRQWGPILVHIFEQHLDYELRSRWELRVGENYSPQVSEFVDFLHTHIRSAEVHPSSSTSTNEAPPTSFKNSNTKARHRPVAKVLTTTAPQTPITKCALCKTVHSIRQCSVFLKEPPTERFKITKTLDLCINCLGSGHSSAACPSKSSCKSCRKRHHSLLHFPEQKTSTNDVVSPISMVAVHPRPQSILLSTLLVNISSIHKETYTFRALLDTGSQVSFITKKCADRLSLVQRRCSARVNTFSGASINAVSGISSIKLAPVGKTEPCIPLDVFIVSKITDATPQSSYSSTSWSHVNNLDLADPTFHTPGPVDILLGADVAPTILTGTRIAGQPLQPTAFGTIFGWILMGPISPTSSNQMTSLLVTTNTTLEKTLTKFWEMEELPKVKHLSPDEIQAETIFTSSIKRLPSGRFSVALPFKHLRPILGDSKGGALRRFHALERRMAQDPTLGKKYSDFMQDYLESKHMEVVPESNKITPYCYYIPHHCILRPESQTTKLRVVFDASSRTTSGQSLNSSVYTGQKLQQEITNILIRARVHKFLFTADIKQMYRQIQIHATDRDYLRILWRFEPDSPIQEYRLCTVTYGTSCAPHQALRTMQYLATIEESRFPIAAKVLKNDMFVDDILTGAQSEEDTLFCQQQVIALCAQGKFQLRKWASNLPSILQAVPATECSMDPAVLFDDEGQAILKILGMHWNPTQDYFSYHYHSPSLTTTKRSVLSDMARIFDPLGFLAPVTFLAKYVMQLLWTSGIGWDDLVPEQILTIWKRYQQELKSIQTLTIPRRITIDGHPTYELHTFSDSSEKGYAAVVYLRCISGSTIQCHLITAKSKVAPLKHVTIPRLELCGTLLAAKLLHSVHHIFASIISITTMHAWTDSTTALSWIKSSPHRWATFVANRTSQLQELTPPSIWRYVPTNDNPADCASRGLYPSEVLHHPLWWSGPRFLYQDHNTWPPTVINNDPDTTNSEERKTTLVVTLHQTVIEDLLNKYSSLATIIHVVAYCSRIFTKSKPITIKLSPHEQVDALQRIIRTVQGQSFSDEFDKTGNYSYANTSKLRKLSPFRDDHGIIRVGGRLNHAPIPYAQKHPILLPRSHRLTNLLIDDFHKEHKHPGATTLQTIIAQQYWIISGRQVIRSRLRLCIACYKTRPRNPQPFMGDMPKYRLQQIKPFMTTGVDYAGPIILKSSTTRRTVPSQAYICLFVCMTTKALHLEVASDLSSETFLMAFCRFISRRGPIEQIHSDCGTNFKGAANLLQPVDQFTHSKEYQNQCQAYLTARNISWHFNPPSAPHFGGLWEAGVKSVKTLLYRILGLQRLTYEELSTLLSRIEATLNSRPLGALSSDPSEFKALTPSHFLTLMSSTATVEPNLEKIPLSHFQRWRLIKDLQVHFWKRWQNEYLQTLQRRSKWTNHSDNLKTNTLVLIREPTPPLLWKLGRILQVHPGQDGIVRVATVQTSTGIIKRPIVKLCPLPTC
ncbi:uncharacterized protein LOC132943558 [Metopolophium dirhodum]|uniref:uncharacterized protein LOC132943558 n=1 Tax=Metopolophium dirhodum TaxID=44670 RepID=UPI0029900AAE|nr:uncharacterized protein LOC132943558 [Metopolophium dirhodum]